MMIPYWFVLPYFILAVWTVMIHNPTLCYVLWLKSCMCHGKRVIGSLYSIKIYLKTYIRCILLLYIIWIMSCLQLQFSLFFALFTGKKSSICYYTHPCLKPSAICFFQIIVGITFNNAKCFWLARWDILNECCNVAGVCVHSYVWLVVSVSVPFWISKYRFWRDIYNKHNKAFSVSP